MLMQAPYSEILTQLAIALLSPANFTAGVVHPTVQYLFVPCSWLVQETVEDIHERIAKFVGLITLYFLALAKSWERRRFCGALYSCKEVLGMNNFVFT